MTLLCPPARRTIKHATAPLALALGISLSTAPLIPGSAIASDEASLNGAMLRAEQVEKVLAHVPGAVSVAANYFEALDGQNLQEAVSALQPLADEIYDPVRSIRQISGALEGSADPEIDTTAFAAAADHLDQAFEKIETALSVVPAPGQDKALDEAGLNAGAEKLQRAYRALLEGREPAPDWTALKALAESMAAPEIAVETALTSHRLLLLERAYMANRESSASREVPDDLEAAAQALVSESRQTQADAGGVFQSDVAREIGSFQMMQALALLSPEDVATLQAFYTSAEGQEKRTRLVEAFRSISDSNAQQLFSRVLADLNKRYPQLRRGLAPQDN